MDMITVTAKTYDEAVTNALIELGTTSEHLYVEVVQRETAGLFGVLGGKSCIINARIMTEEEEAQKKTGEEEKKEAVENKGEVDTKEPSSSEEVKTDLQWLLKFVYSATERRISHSSTLLWLTLAHLAMVVSSSRSALTILTQTLLLSFSTAREHWLGLRLVQS